MHDGAARVADDAELELRPGTRVWVNGRSAIFLYARRSAAVVRYEDERQSRVVSLHKLESTSPD